MVKKQLKVMEEETANLLALLGIEGKVSLEEKEEVVHINIATEETGVLIGFHGETLYGFQLILGLICFKKLGEWSRLVVNVGDYREKREEYLRQLATSKAELARSTKTPQVISGLTPFERRVVHVVISEFNDLVSQSEGEGDNRTLTISLKQ